MAGALPKPAVPDHGGLTAREARCLRDEVAALQVSVAVLSDLLTMARADRARLERRVAELEAEVTAWERRNTPGH